MKDAPRIAEPGRGPRGLVAGLLGEAASFGTWLRAHRRAVLTASALVVLALAYAGFSSHESIGRKPPFDRLYLVLQLFVLNWSPEGRIPLTLQIARFAAPVVSVLGVVAILRLLFAGQLGVLRAWLLRDHVVICGAGRKGSTLAATLGRLGRSVVVIEQGGPGSELATLSDRDIVKIQGDATSMRALKRARVSKAREVVAFTGDDGTNLDVARAAAELSPSGTTRILVHIENDVMANVARTRDPFRDHRADVVNHLQVASRWLVGRHGTGGEVVLVGCDDLARHIALQVGLFWRTVRLDQLDVLRVRLVAPDAPAAVQRLKRQEPSLDQIVQLGALECIDEALAPSIVERELAGTQGRVVVAVVLSDEARAAEAALQIRSGVPSSAVVIARVERVDRGLGRLLAETSDAQRVELLAPATAGVDPEHLFEWRQELLARVLHSDYRRRLLTDAPSTTEPSDLPPWDELSDEEKAQDRARARLLFQRLENFGYAIEGSLKWDLTPLSLSDRDLDSLAKDEHQRWLSLKQAQGWSRGKHKDPKAKIHPDLIEWDGLSEESRGYNRAVARAIPATLASLGVRVAPRRASLRVTH